MQHWSEIKINNFSGPLDLLLTMIRAQKMRIEDIDLIAITNQYLEYLKAQQSLDVEIASEYLTIAAQLVEMKSWALLPKPSEAEANPPSYQAFFNHLTAYETIRQQAQILVKRYEEFQSLKSKPPSSEILDSLRIEAIIPLNLSPETLKTIFLEAWAKHELNLPEDDFESWMAEDADTNFINAPVISPQELTKLVLDQLQVHPRKQWYWDELELILNPEHNIKNLISLFLVLLDLVRFQVITLSQITDNLLIQLTPTATEDQNLLERIKIELDGNQ